MSEHQIAPVALIVDDDKLSRKKLSSALRTLDVTSETAENGAEGLAKMHAGKFDLILLDIVMPEMDGFEVLLEMQHHPHLADIPVLVISSLDETKDTVRALELGAVDFLPKDFARAILKARVEASLEKKRLRDLEKAYLEDVRELTQAAKDLQKGHASPHEMSIGSVVSRSDSLGSLARVFSDLAVAMHERETRARLRFNLLQGTFLLLVMGLTWGMVPALSKVLVGGGGTNPIGIAAWVAVVTLCCISVVLVAYRIRPAFTAKSLRFGLIAGLFAGVLPQVALFWVSSHVPGIVLSITLAMESLIVFAIAATLRMEAPSALRFVGLIVGLLAVLIIMFTTKEAEGVGVPLWVLAGLIVPFSYAVESILVASMPTEENQSPAELLFFIMLGSLIWGWSAALLSGSVINPLEADRSTLTLIGAIGVISAISNGSYVLTIRKMGAVFASQYAYVVTIMGVGWSVILLGERLTLWVLVALGCVLVGMFMVRPKEEAVAFSDLLKEKPSNEPNLDTAA